MSGHTDKVGEPSTLPEPTREEKSAAWNWLKQYALSGIGDARQAYVALWEWTELKKASTASAEQRKDYGHGFGGMLESVGPSPASSERATAGWQFVQDALRMEYERLDYPQRMFPQEAEAIGRSRDALLSAIATVQFAKETKQPLPKVAAASEQGAKR